MCADYFFAQIGASGSFSSPAIHAGIDWATRTRASYKIIKFESDIFCFFPSTASLRRHRHGPWNTRKSGLGDPACSLNVPRETIALGKEFL